MGDLEILIIIASVMAAVAISLVIGYVVSKQKVFFGTLKEDSLDKNLEESEFSLEEIPPAIKDAEIENVVISKDGNGKFNSTKMPDWWKPNVTVLKKGGRRKYPAMFVSKNRSTTKVVRRKRSGLWTTSIFKNEQIVPAS